MAAAKDSLKKRIDRANDDFSKLLKDADEEGVTND